MRGSNAHRSVGGQQPAGPVRHPVAATVGVLYLRMLSPPITRSWQNSKTYMPPHVPGGGRRGGCCTGLGLCLIVRGAPQQRALATQVYSSTTIILTHLSKRSVGFDGGAAMAAARLAGVVWIEAYCLWPSAAENASSCGWSQVWHSNLRPVNAAACISDTQVAESYLGNPNFGSLGVTGPAGG